jgi:hypothetical protein
MAKNGKGNGYNPIDAIAAAITRAGGTVEVFFANAQRIKSADFVADFEAQQFKDFQANPTAFPRYKPLQCVVEFANWVLVAENKVLLGRYRR